MVGHSAFLKFCKQGDPTAGQSGLRHDVVRVSARHRLITLGYQQQRWMRVNQHIAVIFSHPKVGRNGNMAPPFRTKGGPLNPTLRPPVIQAVFIIHFLGSFLNHEDHKSSSTYCSFSGHAVLKHCHSCLSLRARYDATRFKKLLQCMGTSRYMYCAVHSLTPCRA